MPVAVIFVPAGQFDLYAAQCYDHCAARGYHVAGVVTGDWAAVQAMLRSSAADVAVVARWDHLDPNRVPRLEIAADAATKYDNSRTPSLRRRRPHQI